MRSSSPSRRPPRARPPVAAAAAARAEAATRRPVTARAAAAPPARAEAAAGWTPAWAAATTCDEPASRGAPGDRDRRAAFGLRDRRDASVTPRHRGERPALPRDPPRLPVRDLPARVGAVP